MTETLNMDELSESAIVDVALELNEPEVDDNAANDAVEDNKTDSPVEPPVGPPE